MVENLSAPEVARLLRDSPRRVTLLDVREPSERATSAIEPSLHIPMGEIPERAAELPKDGRLVVYCHHGTRSMMVALYLELHGFEDVANLSGGIDGWSCHVDETVARY